MSDRANQRVSVQVGECASAVELAQRNERCEEREEVSNSGGQFLDVLNLSAY